MCRKKCGACVYQNSAVSSSEFQNIDMLRLNDGRFPPSETYFNNTSSKQTVFDNKGEDQQESLLGLRKNVKQEISFLWQCKEKLWENQSTHV